MKTRAATPLRRRSRTAAFPSEEDLISVLFIEDDAHLAEMYRLKLELDGYTVDVAEARRSIRKLAALQASTVCFGHGRPLTVDAADEINEFAAGLPPEEPTPP